MKNKSLIALICFCLLPLSGNAATCSVDDLNRLDSSSKLIKGYYEVILEEIDKDTLVPPESLTEEELEEYYNTPWYDQFMKINVENISSDYYVKVTNDYDSEVEILNSTSSYFLQENIMDVITYTFTVYASGETDCEGEKLHEFSMITPRYNFYYETELCNSYRDEAACEEYTFSEYLSLDTFEEEIEKLKLEEEKEEEQLGFFEKMFNYIGENIIAITFTTILIVAGVVAVVLVNKKRSGLK